MVIIWTDDDPFNWGPYASPGLNVLKVLFLFFPFFTWNSVLVRLNIQEPL